MKAGLTFTDVPPASLAEHAVVSELGGAALGTGPLGGCAHDDEVTLLGPWERMHVTFLLSVEADGADQTGLYDDQAVGCYCNAVVATTSQHTPMPVRAFSDTAARI